LVFVELPKFTKQLEELESVIDKWIFFIKEAPNLEIIPDKLREIPQLEQALTIANQAGLSVSEVEKLRKQEMALEDARRAWSFAKREGREEGREQGRLEGREEGRLEEKQQIAKQMKAAGLPLNDIAQYTGLTIDEINQLS
ncbi:MAG: Rpn family recombination-promoting nuclease/putative transposase, partial [Moorea sp. SIO4A1]|uniref:Rpn family recombination-promoting nuclease/putative transposase n=1 Tax=Moorena sp. SIO4A1 TaxID=2607835 RepID=UPI00144ECFAF